MNKIVLVLVSLAFLFLTPTAQATTINVTGVNYPDLHATADFNYNPLTATTGRINVDLTNTSLIDSSLTAFAFNAPSNISGATLTTAPNTNWTALLDFDNVNTPGQFGLFDTAAITGPNFNGGSPSDGILSGNSGFFVFDLIGTTMDTLNTDSFLSLFSFLDDKQGDPQNFITRFQAVGADGEGSDVGIPGGTAPVPEPSTIVLLASGIGCLFFLKRKGSRSA